MMKLCAIVLAGVSVLAVVTHADPPPDDVQWTCNTLEFSACMWHHGRGPRNQGAPTTPEEMRVDDAAWAACKDIIDNSPVKGWNISSPFLSPAGGNPAEAHDYKNAGEADADVARCRQCAATTPKGSWCKIGNSGALGGTGYGGTRTPPQADRAADLARCFEQSARDKMREGYYVKNDGWWTGFKNGVRDLTPFRDNVHGGRCGEYGERGMQWIKPCVDQLFGPSAVVDDIVVIEKSNYRARSKNADWSDTLNPDQMFESNHRSARVVLPDGRRFVVDYWDAISSGNPRMVPEDEWAKKWTKKVGDQLIGVDSGIVLLSEDQQALKNLVTRFGEDKGFQAFKASGRGLKGDPQVWINAWKLDPW